jgi:hypothetical protein
MNYLKVYCNLIRKAENRTSPEGYTEKHHVFPKSIFGKNDRIVVLTTREHYIAHVLLEKIFIRRYGKKDQRTIKMNYAHMFMVGDRDKVGKYFNSILYENSRKRHSENFSGDNHPRRKNPDLWKDAIGDKSHTKREEYRKMFSDMKKGEKNPMYGKKGEKNPLYKRKRTPEAIQKSVDGKCKRTYNIKSPTGEEYITKNLRKFCRDYGLNSSCMYNVLGNRLKSYKGWKVYYI